MQNKLHFWFIIVVFDTRNSAHHRTDYKNQVVEMNIPHPGFLGEPLPSLSCFILKQVPHLHKFLLPQESLSQECGSVYTGMEF